MSTDNILTVEHLNKEFKSGEDRVHVLNDVSFAIARGSSCAVVGPSGSGKTTLIAICAGLERPSQGAVEFDGEALHQASEEKLARIRNQSIGFIFQSFQLLPSLTALENVMVPAEISGERLVRASALELLGRVGLRNRMYHYPMQLSGGEQQRVAIARAFMNQPKILFADEPTGNLDAETAESIVKLIFNLNSMNRTTLILVTHDRELTEQADRVITLKAGRLASDITKSAACGCQRLSWFDDHLLETLGVAHGLSRQPARHVAPVTVDVLCGAGGGFGSFSVLLPGKFARQHSVSIQELAWRRSRPR